MEQKKVLLVCDNVKNLQDLFQSFSFTQEYSLESAQSREHSLRLLKEGGAYSLIVIDLEVSPTATLELLREVKRKYRDRKVLVLTADKRQTLEIMIRGAIDIIFKPFDKFDLMHHVDDLMKDHRSCKRFELKDCDIKIVLLNQDGVRLSGVINNICLDGILIEIEDLVKANEFFHGRVTVDVLFQPSHDEPLVKIFRGNVVRIFKDQQEKGEMAIYLTPERDINFLDDFVSYFKIDLKT
jgi:two-component system response regulator